MWRPKQDIEMKPLIQEKIALIAAVVGVLELLGALGCLITALLFGNVTNTDLQAGQLYAKYYDSSSPTRRYGTNGGTYWWIGLPVSIANIQFSAINRK